MIFVYQLFYISYSKMNWQKFVLVQNGSHLCSGQPRGKDT